MRDAAAAGANLPHTQLRAEHAGPQSHVERELPLVVRMVAGPSPLPHAETQLRAELGRQRGASVIVSVHLQDIVPGDFQHIPKGYVFASVVAIRIGEEKGQAEEPGELPSRYPPDDRKE